MAFAATSQSGAFHYLAEFFLDSTTLYYADEDLSMRTSNTTGVFYEGRLPSSGVLVRDLGTFLEPRETISTFDVMVDNSDGQMAALIRDCTFANREARIWLGEGRSKDAYSEVFRGYIAHPNGVSWDESQTRFTLVDKRVKDRRILPPVAQKYDPDTYPQVESRYRAQPIPIVFGNWASNAGEGLTVPCARIAHAANYSWHRFKVACHGIKSIDKFYLNAAEVKRNQLNAPLDYLQSAATFSLTGISYDATNDTMAVNCQGIFTANNTVIDNPAYVLKKLLTSGFLGLTGSDLSGTAFCECAVAADPLTARRYLSDETSSEVVIGELLNEAGIDLRFVEGQYAPKYRALDMTSARPVYQDVDIVLEDEANEKAAFRVERDPDRFYANQIRGRYAFDPVDVKFTESFVSNSAAAIAHVQGTVERQMDFSWFYNTTDVQDRIRRELFIFSREPDAVELTLTRRALQKNLADQFDLDYSIYSNTTFQIRRMETDLGAMTTRVRGVDLFTDVFAIYTNDAAPTWANATIAERQDYGFWTDANGYADSSDPGSDVSVYS